MQSADDGGAGTDPVAVLGAGHVGLVTAVGFTHHGIPVRVGEAAQSRLDLLRSGSSPFREPGLDELLEEGVERGLLTFHSDNAEAAAGAAAVFVAVPTPAASDGTADLSAVKAAILSIAAAVGEGVVVVKSSVPPGSWRRIASWMSEAGCRGRLVINPEFLQEGSAVRGVLEPARVVIGGEHPAAVEVVARLHEPFGGELVRTDPASAELIKYAANTYLAMRVSFINSIANLADRVGADIDDVIRGIALDPRIGSHFLRPGPGYGGACFPKDLPALVAVAAIHGLDMPLVTGVMEVNRRQPDLVLAKLTDALGELSGRKIALLGLAFKAGTDDARISPAVLLAERMVAAGAEVTAYDPAASVEAEGMTQVRTPEDAIRGADAVLIATEWREFADLDPLDIASLMNGRVIVDARNVLDKDAVVAAGLDYRGLGR